MLRALDLFAGAGGLSLGARWAGVDPVIAVEKDRYAAETYQANFPSATVLTDDVSKLELPNANIDVLLAGPPCQAFSTSNQRTRNDRNPLNAMLLEPVRFIEAIRPRLVILENVGGLAIGTRRSHLERLLNSLRSIGYSPQVIELASSEMGVPQRRKRIFIVAGRGKIRDLRFQSPGKTVSVKDAIYDLPLLECGSSIDLLPYQESVFLTDYARSLRGSLTQCSGNLVTKNNDSIIKRYTFIPEGGNWKSIPADLMHNYADVTRCHTGIYHRLQWGEPSKVIGNFRKNMLIHPDQHRGLSIREAARLQSFPDNFTFHGSIGKRQQQVGNAVPPLMASQVVMSATQAAGLV